MPGTLANYWTIYKIGRRYLREVKHTSFEEAHKLRVQTARDLIESFQITYTVDRPEALNLGRPCIYVANHSAMIDPVVLCCLLEWDVRFLAKSVLFHIPLISGALKAEHHIPVFRNAHTAERRDQLKAAVAQAISEGACAFFFPEGTRTTTGELGPFKLGAFFNAVQNDVPIVPICIHGLFELNPKTSYAIKPGHCEIHVFDPIDAPKDGSERERAQKLADLSREIIAADLAKAKPHA